MRIHISAILKAQLNAVEAAKLKETVAVALHRVASTQVADFLARRAAAGNRLNIETSSERDAVALVKELQECGLVVTSTCMKISRNKNDQNAL